MPLITLTCQRELFPPDPDLSREGEGGLTEEQNRVVQLAAALPDLIISRSRALRLDGDTPQEAVQVDITKFHGYAVNAVRLWVKIEFTEQVDCKNDRLAIRDTLENMIYDTLRDHGLITTWALDVFCGPGHGCYTNDKGTVIQEW